MKIWYSVFKYQPFWKLNKTENLYEIQKILNIVLDFS